MKDAVKRGPSIFVERRFGVGWSPNLGNPAGLVILAGLLVVVLIPLAVRLLSGATR